jgi:hypothetical protein
MQAEPGGRDVADVVRVGPSPGRREYRASRRQRRSLPHHVLRPGLPHLFFILVAAT